jgi:hypothetical protein
MSEIAELNKPGGYLLITGMSIISISITITTVVGAGTTILEAPYAKA